MNPLRYISAAEDYIYNTRMAAWHSGNGKSRRWPVLFKVSGAQWCVCLN